MPLTLKLIFLENLFLYLIFLQIIDVQSDKRGDDCLTKRIECEQFNNSKKMYKVCGSDNVTYTNYCYLNMESCSGKNVTLQHNGRCRTKKPCFKVLKNLQNAKKSNQMSFVPTCLEDGRYAPVQCHKQTGYCWCVTPKGRPVPNTSRRNVKPKCHKRIKTRRRASAKNRDHCSRSDKQKFLINLLNMFKSEYGFSKENHDIDDKVIDWKFEALDVNSDDVLQRHEYRVLKTIKQIVKPKKCFKSFSRICDLDRDLKISREEWSLCLSTDFSLKSASVTLTGHAPGLEVKRKDEPEVNDCSSDRQAVLSEHRANDLYIPECTPDGRYNKIQCYKSTGYCWCVHEDDGKPIPGTSVKDQTPKCDSVPAPVRPMKGCPGEKKTIFLKDLNIFLTQKMYLANNYTDNSVASWSFETLDVNNNKYLERKEWKAFRALVANVKNLRRCGKRLPKYCDINNDRKLSITEWFKCLEPTSSPVNVNVSITRFNSSIHNTKRKGPNPLESLLKDDD